MTIRIIRLVWLAFFASSLFLPLFAQAEISEESPAYKDFLVKFVGEQQVKTMRFANQKEAEQLLKIVVPDKRIEYIESDFLVYASMIPNDTDYSQQWTLPHINAEEAWEESDGSGVVVAVLDSGTDLDHPDLEANIWTNSGEIAGNGVDDDANGYIDDTQGWDFVGNDNDPNPDLSEYETYLGTDQYSTWESGVNHGTVVAGIIGAVGNNQQGIIGVSYESKVMVIRMLNSLGVGSTSSVANAVNYAVEMGADVINLSFTGSNTNNTLENALKNASDSGVLIVASAGNNDYNLNNTRIYPACSDLSGNKLIIGVGATEQSNQKASWSNYGSDCVDLSAPGSNMYSTTVYDTAKGQTDYYQSGWYGTSLSAPLVSGTAALVKSAFPDSTNLEIMDTIVDHASDLNQSNPDYQDQLGGLLDANASLVITEIYNTTNAPIVTGAGYGGGPHVRIFDQYGNVSSQFFAFAETFRGGVNVAVGDVDGDNQHDVIVGAGQGGGPHVRIFDQSGNLITEFFAFDEDFRGGVNVAVGNVDLDDQLEIITGAGNGGGPQVRIFDYQGNLENQFFAYGENFRGGVYVATGDLDGNGTDEILTGTGNGGGPQVRIFDSIGNSVFTPGFFAYAENFRGGVLVAAGDLNGDGRDDIITGTGVSGGPHVRTFDRFGQAIYTPGFFAYAEHFRGGVLVSTGDLNGDGQAEIITGTGLGGGPHVRTFDRYGNSLYTPGFFAYDENFRGGVFVGSDVSIVTTTYQYGLE